MTVNLKYDLGTWKVDHNGNWWPITDSSAIEIISSNVQQKCLPLQRITFSRDALDAFRRGVHRSAEEDDTRHYNETSFDFPF